MQAAYKSAGPSDEYIYKGSYSLLIFSTSSVANVISVAGNPQVLVNAPLDAVAAAAKTNVDAAVDVAVGICAAVDL